MPPCVRAALPQSTPRPDNSAQFLTQWRYGSWTAVSDTTLQITRHFKGPTLVPPQQLWIIKLTPKTFPHLTHGCICLVYY